MPRIKDKSTRTVLFIQNLDANVKAQFKAYCAKRGIGMTKMLEQMMRETIKNQS